MSGGGGSGTGWSNPLRKRMNPELWAMQGPAAALGLQRAYGSPYERQQTYADLSGQIQENAAGATNRLGSSMASHGIDMSSPMAGAAMRGINTQAQSDQAGAWGTADKAMRDQQAKYFQTLFGGLTSYPPSENYSQQSYKGGK